MATIVTEIISLGSSKITLDKEMVTPNMNKDDRMDVCLSNEVILYLADQIRKQVGEPG